MKRYEAMFLMESGHAAARWSECLKQIQEVLKRHGCEIIRLVKWDDRKLAYEIQHHKRGTYVLVYFSGPSEAVARIERDVQLSEELLRVLILRRDKMAEEKMLQMPVPSGEANIIGREPEPVAAAAVAVAGEAGASASEKPEGGGEVAVEGTGA